MRAGISSEKSSSRRSGIFTVRSPSGEGFVTAVAKRLVRGTLAGAEPDFLAGGGFPFLRAECGALMRSVAERLRLGARAAPPPVRFAAHDVDGNGPRAANFRHLAHLLAPPP